MPCDDIGQHEINSVLAPPPPFLSTELRERQNGFFSLPFSVHAVVAINAIFIMRECCIKNE